MKIAVDSLDTESLLFKSIYVWHNVNDLTLGIEPHWSIKKNKVYSQKCFNSILTEIRLIIKQISYMRLSSLSRPSSCYSPWTLNNILWPQTWGKKFIPSDYSLVKRPTNTNATCVSLGNCFFYPVVKIPFADPIPLKFS